MEQKYNVIAINKNDMSSLSLMSFKSLKEAQSFQKSLIEGKDLSAPVIYAIDSYVQQTPMTTVKSK